MRGDRGGRKKWKTEENSEGSTIYYNIPAHGSGSCEGRIGLGQDSFVSSDHVWYEAIVEVWRYAGIGMQVRTYGRIPTNVSVGKQRTERTDSADKC